MTGVDLARAAYLEQPDLPVIFATGQNVVDGVPETIRSLLLRKPYTPDSLGRAVESALHPLADGTAS